MSNQYGGEPPQQPAQGGAPQQPNGQPPLPQQQPGFANPYAGVPGTPEQQGVPPYASAPGQQPHSYVPHGPQAPYGAQAPYSAPQPYAAPAARRGLSGGAIAGIVVGAVAVVGLIALGIFFALTVLFVPKAPPYAAPTPASPPTVAPVPTATPVEPEATAEPTAEATAEAAPDPELAGKTKTMLSDMRTKYANTGDAAYVWQQIPKTTKNEGAVQAFAYAIADMQAAMIWGPSAADLQEYQTKALEYERKLLAQEPLGVNMKIGRGDGTTFNYDGDTGESWVSTGG